MWDCSCWGHLSDSSVSSSNYSKFYPETSQFFNSTRFLRISFNSCCRLQKALKFLLKRIVDLFTLTKITIVYHDTIYINCSSWLSFLHYKCDWYSWILSFFISKCIKVEEIQILERFGEFWTNKKSFFLIKLFVWKYILYLLCSRDKIGAILWK